MEDIFSNRISTHVIHAEYDGFFDDRYGINDINYILKLADDSEAFISIAAQSDFFSGMFTSDAIQLHLYNTMINGDDLSVYNPATDGLSHYGVNVAKEMLERYVSEVAESYQNNLTGCSCEVADMNIQGEIVRTIVSIECLNGSDFC